MESQAPLLPESSPEPEPVAKPRCPNCDKKMPRSAEFCPHCGQKQSAVKVKLSDLLLKLWTSTFHLDNKFMRMVWHLLLPGKVTVEYFKGRVKRYPHPIQFFFICIFFLLFYVSRKADQAPDLHVLDILGPNNVAELKGKLDLYETIQANWDSLPPEMQTPASRAALDTVMAKSAAPFLSYKKDSVSFDVIWVLDTPYRIAKKDIVELPLDSLDQKYRIRRWVDRLIIHQSIKSATEPEGLGRFWIGAMAWIFLCQIAVAAGWMKLLYRRQARYYVEHVVFLIHLHSGFLFLLAMTLVIRKFFGLEFFPKSFGLWWLLFGLLFGMRRFYQQSWSTTLFKWAALCILYLLSFLVVFTLSLLVSLLVF